MLNESLLSFASIMLADFMDRRAPTGIISQHMHRLRTSPNAKADRARVSDDLLGSVKVGVYCSRNETGEANKIPQSDLLSSKVTDETKIVFKTLIKIFHRHCLELN
jgi:hypothetical protein